MVINQVVFIMLSYNLLQRYLLRQGRKELNNETLPHIRQQLLPSDNHIIPILIGITVYLLRSHRNCSDAW